MSAKFIYSKQTAIQKYEDLKKVSDIVSYSSKTNPVITKILENNTDSMFSVHLEQELRHVNDKSKVMFLAQAWDEELIRTLINQDIKWFIVDNHKDLDVLKSFLDKSNNKIKVSLRMKLKEHTVRTEKYYVFGMSAKKTNEEVKTLSKHKNVEEVGIHFHRKTQNITEWDYKEILEDTINVFDILGHINIGGGMPSTYANTNEKVYKSIFRKLGELKKWLNSKNVKMITEPGRYIAAPTATLQAKITLVYNNTIVLDTSVYQSDMDALIVPVKLLVEEELQNKKEGKPYHIKGKTPCSMDLFRYKVYLKNPKKGDFIHFKNAGAYNFHTNFCSMQKLEKIIR